MLVLKCGKDAIAMAKEKPLFGWGIQGATEKRKQETKEKLLWVILDNLLMLIINI